MTHECHTIPYVALEVDPEALIALHAFRVVREIAEDWLEDVMLPESVPLIEPNAAGDAGCDGRVTGNVFLPAGGEPQFVWCERLSDDANPDPLAVRITLSCAGAVRCAAEPCASAGWTALGEVALAGSFFVPQ